ncbi:MAG: LysE family translocator [Congregibacter sp.]
MNLPEWLSLAGLCVAGAASPGASLAVVVAANVSGQRVAGLAAAWAHAFGVGLYAALTVIGLGAIVTTNQTVFTGLQCIGAFYLLWLAFGMWCSATSDRTASAKPSVAATRTLLAARDGFAVAFLNPKLAVFMLALFSQFIKPDAGRWDGALMIATATVIDGLWYTLVTLMLHRGNWIARLQNNAAALDRVFGALLAGVACLILWRALSAML